MNDCADYADGGNGVIAVTFTKLYTYDSAVRHLEKSLNNVLTARGYHESEGIPITPEPAKKRKSRYFGKNAQPFPG